MLNHPPVGVDDSNGTAKGSTLKVSAVNGVLANDTDPDPADQGHLIVSQVNAVAGNVGHTIQGTYGSLTLFSDGSYVYVANKGALPPKIVAQDTFQYTVTDPLGAMATADVNIVVLNPGVNYIAGKIPRWH